MENSTLSPLPACKQLDTDKDKSEGVRSTVCIQHSQIGTLIHYRLPVMSVYSIASTTK